MNKTSIVAFHDYRVAKGKAFAETNKAYTAFIVSVVGAETYTKTAWNKVKNALSELKDSERVAYDATKKDGENWTGSPVQKDHASFTVAIRKRYSEKGITVAEPRKDGGTKGGNGKGKETETTSPAPVIKTTNGAKLPPMLDYLEGLKSSGMSKEEVKKAFNGCFVEVFGVSPYSVS